MAYAPYPNSMFVSDEGLFHCFSDWIYKYLYTTFSDMREEKGNG